MDAGRTRWRHKAVSKYHEAVMPPDGEQYYGRWMLVLAWCKDNNVCALKNEEVRLVESISECLLDPDLVVNS